MTRPPIWNRFAAELRRCRPLLRQRRDQQFLDLVLALVDAGQLAGAARAWNDHDALRKALHREEGLELPACPAVEPAPRPSENLSRFARRYFAGRPNHLAVSSRR